MSTGIQRKKRSKIPIKITYEGKETEEEILSSVYEEKFSNIASINGNRKGDNLFFYGDNFDSLSLLLQKGYKGTVNLIYIDPPFATSSDFANRKLEHAYSDALQGGEYVEFMRKRLILMRELLSEKGSIYLHLDATMAFVMKLVMDEIFGEENCRAFITRRKCSTKNYTKNTYGNISDYILFYSKGPCYTWNRPYDPWQIEKLNEEYPCIDEKSGKRYKKVPLHAPGIRNGETGKEWRGKLPPEGKHWQYTPEKLDELDASGEIYWSPTGNPRRKIFSDSSKGVPVQDIWLNYRDCINQAQKTTGYPTEKNFEMLKMIVKASSNPGDLVLDCFAGSGTTLQAAFECKRKWIGADNSPESLKAILKRFTSGLEEYGDYVNPSHSHPPAALPPEEKCPFTLLASEDLKSEAKSILVNATEKKKVPTPRGITQSKSRKQMSSLF